MEVTLEEWRHIACSERGLPDGPRSPA
jgi:hypothetical protein